jgi:hypothetical protein
MDFISFRLAKLSANSFLQEHCTIVNPSITPTCKNPSMGECMGALKRQCRKIFNLCFLSSMKSSKQLRHHPKSVLFGSQLTGLFQFDV